MAKKWGKSKSEIMNLAKNRVIINNMKSTELLDWLKSANRYANLQVANQKRFTKKSGFETNIGREYYDKNKNQYVSHLTHSYKIEKDWAKEPEKYVNRLRHELSSALDFIGGDTAHIYSSKYTDKTYYSVMKDVVERLDINEKNITQDDLKAFWETYNYLLNSAEIQDIMRNSQYGSNQLQKDLYSIMKDDSFEASSFYKSGMKNIGSYLADKFKDRIIDLQNNRGEEDVINTSTKFMGGNK